MPTIFLVVTGTLHPETTKNAIVQFKQIHKRHKYEQISVLATEDGQNCAVLTSFTKETKELCSTLEGLNFKERRAQSLQSAALRECFKHVEDIVGIYSCTQIIILTDYADYNDELIRLKPIIPVKIHCFCVTDITEEPVAPVVTIVKEENAPKPPAPKAPLNPKWNKFTKHHRGTIQMVDRQLSKKPKSKEFMSKHYAKYSGYVTFGHLSNPIELFPDPNLVLWDSTIPAVLSIVAFVHTLHMSSPACTSKHTILRFEDNKTAKGKKLSRQERIKYGKKKIIKTEQYKADDQPADSSFFVMLHDLLLNEKYSAIVHLYDKQYAHISVAYTEDSTGLVLGIFDESTGAQYASENSQTTTTRGAHPWLKSGIEKMYKDTLTRNQKRGPLPKEILDVLAQEPKSEQDLQQMLTNWLEDDDQEGLDLYQRDSKKIYNFNLKSTKEGQVVPYSKKQTLQGDFQKVLRTAKLLPDAGKEKLFYQEIEKLRYTSAVYMNMDIITSLVAQLQDQRDKFAQEPDRKETVMIMDMAISNLIHKDVWKTKMKAPQYAEPSSARDDDYQPPQKKRKEG